MNKIDKLVEAYKSEKVYTQSDLDAARIEGAELGWDAGLDSISVFHSPTKEQFLSSLNKKP